ncbi:hypothetical protein QFC22_003886 [Naganishia vaughanmartiniae]|uniref:Uncharacterized protein n=1 Tax=Naganishia vaughanmartiniae TaxID=1424756 RepID=A0ACC2X5G6_9TREE|nr:hypothetical protein QFC22_003886 [Naganishia vaughanmartiniae]
MIPPNNNGLPLPHPSLPGNPLAQQPQAAPQNSQPQMMQYLHMQMAMQQQFMQNQSYAYGGHYNPQMMMRQSLFQPVSYQAMPTQNEQGYTYSASYLEQQQQQQQPGQSSSHALPASTQPIDTSSSLSTSKRQQKQTPAPNAAKKPRLHAPAKPNVTSGGAWRNCVQEGCAFVGPSKDVDLHEQDRHLIYKERKVERSEEEEAALRGGGPAPPIPGTSIRLETEEDIAKWIAQRRARWPTASRVEEKEKERQDKIARGEIDPHASTRGRRGRGGRAAPSTRGGRGRGAAEQSSGGRTRDAGYQQRSQPALTTEKKEQPGSDDTSPESDSGSDSDSDSDSASVSSTGDGPTKTSELPNTSSPVQVKSPPPSRQNKSRAPQGNQKPPRVQPPAAFTLSTTSSRPSLLAALLENPINQTLSSLSQAIQFLVDNDFLYGVELHEGDFVEAISHGVGKKQKLVQLVEDVPDAVSETGVEGGNAQNLVHVVQGNPALPMTEMEADPGHKSVERAEEGVLESHKTDVEAEARRESGDMVAEEHVPVLLTAEGDAVAPFESAVLVSESVASLVEDAGAGGGGTVDAQPSKMTM